MHLKQDIRLLCFIMLFIGLLMAVPFTLSLYYGEEKASDAFIKTYIILFALTLPLLFAFRKEEQQGLTPKDGYFFVSFTWILGTAIACVPLILSGDYPDYPSAYFEIMSGFTTTGATVLEEIESHHRSILFWRSMTNWLGGMGIVVLFVAILPTFGSGGMGNILVGAESVGPTKDKLTPKIKYSAMALWIIYLVFSILQAILLMLGGLDWYDAVTVTFSTMSAAGFCVKNTSIGAFNSAYVDITVTVFMMLSGANFALYYKALTGKLKDVLHDGELRAYLAIWGLCTFFCALSLTVSKIYPSFWTSLRYSSFINASIITTTGFATADYANLWPSLCQAILLLLFFVGGCAGSAGGGIKVIRIVTLFKMASAHIKTRIHPRGVYHVRIGKTIIPTTVCSSIAGFSAIYIATGLIGTIVVTITGADLLTAFASSFLCLGNIGIGFGEVGPTGNFGIYPGWTKMFLSFLMLSGRLELFTVYALFAKEFWRTH